MEAGVSLAENRWGGTFWGRPLRRHSPALMGGGGLGRVRGQLGAGPDGVLPFSAGAPASSGLGGGMAQEGAEICPRWTGHHNRKVSQTAGRSWQLPRISESSLHGDLLTGRFGLSRQRAGCIVNLVYVLANGIFTGTGVLSAGSLLSPPQPAWHPAPSRVSINGH